MTGIKKVKIKLVVIMFVITAFIFAPFVGRHIVLAQETVVVQEFASAPDPALASTPEPTIVLVEEPAVASEPEPVVTELVPTPEPTSEPTAEPAPESTPVSEPTPAPEPTPEPTTESELVPEPVPPSDFIPAETPEPATEPAPAESAEETTPASVETATEPTEELAPTPPAEPTTEEGIVLETASSTAEAVFPGFFKSISIQSEEKDKDGKPIPAFWQIFYYAPDGTETQITDNGYDNLQFQSQGTKAVWKAYPKPGHAEIFFYDAQTKDRKQISINNSSNDDPILTGDGRVVWRGWDLQLGTWNIYFYNGRETSRISNTGEGALWPSIDGDVITWQEKSGGVWQIMAYNIETRRPWLITGDSRNNERPQTDGRNIVWQKEISEGLHDIFLYDLKTERLWKVSKGPGDKVLPHIIKGKKIIWFSPSNELDNQSFEEIAWSPDDAQDLAETKPTPLITSETENPLAQNSVSITESPPETTEIESIAVEGASSPTVLEIMPPTEQENAQESVPVETVSPETVSVTEPLPEAPSEIVLPAESIGPLEESSVPVLAPDPVSSPPPALEN